MGKVWPKGNKVPVIGVLSYVLLCPECGSACYQYKSSVGLNKSRWFDNDGERHPSIVHCLDCRKTYDVPLLREMKPTISTDRLP